MFEYYEEPIFTNDLLSLMYILDGNVDRIVFTSRMDPKVFPKEDTVPTKYAEVLSSFGSFLDFYRDLKEEGEHAEIIAYYKLKHSRLSFMALHSKYVQIIKKMDKEEDITYYNKNLYKTLLECNEYASNRGSSDMFLAPFYTSRFFKQNGELGKSRRLRKEARRIARISNRLNAIQEMDNGI
ncbi:hypothetical protein EROM_050840 [Encephalitozoon romaleae SJ-2008]|uniref:Uncharacterized protein n=1 Tax=Encephalitozoon romaleae (strain SJ-2008) TaxID=1178016 RepID=I6ZTM2_ENCRO|nr:hypothetical protein EROM_050840 [Encephalitozoon romaleae SJ-2008]AFN83016.1 hypothetical protein EROM_050840 [Encephalitozoon romaleae SJ-2008]